MKARLGAQRIRKKPSAPRNFATTTVASETGEVRSTSSVPLVRSSANRRIVRIGTMKSLKIQKNVFVNISDKFLGIVVISRWA